MASPKKLEMTALAGLVLQGAFLLTCVLLGARSGSRAVAAEAWHAAAGLLVWFLVLVHGRQRRLAQQESEERERLRESRLSEEIFEETELDTMRAGTGLLIFEKYFVPFFSVVLSGLLLYFGYRIASGTWGQSWTVEGPAAVAVGMVAFSFFGFLIGKYAAGLAQNRGFRLLRAAGGYIIGNVIVAVLIAVSMAMYHFDIVWGEQVLVYLIPAIMALVGLEVLLNLVLDIYRPRVEGQEARPPYDSRLLGLFAEPEGVLRTVAATLDYQFGFKVSDTWFYHFMERAILPLLLVQVASLWLLTTLVVVDQDEIVFIENFGQPYVSTDDAARGLKATLFYPGLHLKAPWPFAVARHVPAYRVHSLEVGKVYEPRTHPGPAIGIAPDLDIILWGEEHIHPDVGFEASFLVPSTVELEEEDEEPAWEEQGEPAEGAQTQEGPAADTGQERKVKRAAPPVNLARLTANVHYRVKTKPDGQIDDNAAFTYHYRESDIEEHVKKLGYRAICRIAASQDFLKWVAEERTKTVDQFGRLMQEAFDEAGMGLEVVYVTIPAVHPPAPVAAAFAGVVTAMEGKEALIHEAEQEEIRTVEKARALRAALISRARGTAYRLKTIAKAEADQFEAQLRAYNVAPRVYMYRTYFDAMEKALPDQKVFVVPVTANEVQIIDLQPKIRTGLLEGLDVMEE